MTEGQIQPRYAEKFHCTGSECPDTCCAGWQVGIDRDTYEKYRKLPDWVPVLNEKVSLAKSGTETEFAYIKLLEKDICPFLSADRMCEIQKAHGAEYLSKTCSDFPRADRVDRNVEKRTLYLSCPEAARIVLLAPELLPADEVEGGTHARYRRFLLPKSAGKSLSTVDTLWMLQRFSLVLIKDRRYPMWQRLFILGMFCGRLHDLALGNQLEFLPKVLSEYTEMIMDKRLKSHLERIKGRPALQLDLTRRFIKRAFQITPAISLHESSDDFIDGDVITPSHVAAYEAAERSYYEPIMQAHPFLLENYLTNFILQNGFPFNDRIASSMSYDFRPIYFLMCTHYAVIRTMLIGMSGQYREAFGTQHVVKLVQGFFKAAQHNTAFMNETVQFICGSGLNHPGEISTLLKN